MNRSVLLLLATTFLSPGGVADVVSRGPWSGAITHESAVVVGKLDGPAQNVWLELSPQADFAAAQTFAPNTPAADQAPEIARIELRGLKPDTVYYYRFCSAGNAMDEDDHRSTGTFRTFPIPGSVASFKFAFSSCGRTGSTHAVYRQIKAQQPRVFLTIGDLHYEDIERDHREAFRSAYDSVLGSNSQRELYRSVPIVYTWDDHDFGPNGSDRHSPSRLASLAIYREYVPHYPLEAPEPDGPIAQAFTLGRARFIVLDCRSARDAAGQPDDADKTMLGSWQKAWLQRELLAANRKFPLIFIVSSVSWVSDETSQRDNWGRFATERAELSNWMVDQGITGVCFLSGDAHMLAADDGRNNNYARNGGPNFPALQAAPLDRSGSIKGGPWSVAPVLPEPGEGQFGLVEVDDRGDKIHVLFRGLNQEGEEKLRLEFSVAGE
ncbi:MAG: alkaline phosphatase D family protein [Candidatus Didemnitutus sp.]|nr:alkaline phosphatase D family protein [Candidatus Didemnitutus sp.]